MLQVLSNRTYRHLFLAQVIALVGTGLATVALGLLAYDLAGADAGRRARNRACHQDDRLCRRRTDRRGIRRAPAATNDAGQPGSHTRCGRPGSAVRHADLGDLSSHFRSAVGLGSLHANVPGDHSRCSSGREGVYTGAVTIPPGLRPRERGQSDACRSTSDAYQLSQPVCGNGRRLFGIRRACRLGGPAKPESQ